MTHDKPRHIAFIRNVMIGREGLHRQVLLDMFVAAGAVAPRSYISTGNVSFSAPESALPTITAVVEKGIESIIGRGEPLFIRPVASLEALVARNPFSVTPYTEVIERTVSFVPTGTDLSLLELPRESPSGKVCLFAATGTEVLSVGRLVGGRTQGAGGFVERTLGCRVTSRSWSTVLRIVEHPE